METAVKRAKDFTLFRKGASMMSFTPVIEKAKEEEQYQDRAMYVNAALHNSELGKIDWQNKIVFKLSEMDIGDILFAFASMNPVSIVHKLNDTSPIRVLEIKPNNNSFRISLSENQEGKDNKFVYINVLPKEIMVLKAILNHAILQLTGRAPI